MIYKIGGFLFIFLALLSFKDFRNLYEALTADEKVNVRMTYVDPCGLLSSDVYYYIKFEFNKKTYVKMVGSDACKKWTVGNEYKLRYNRKRDSFHLDHDMPIWPIISNIFFLIFAILSFRQSSKTTNA
jgi:hypothetical protein